MSKPEDVVLTVENPVILDEPETKKPYTAGAWVCSLIFLFAIMAFFESPDSSSCFCGLTSILVGLILTLLDLQQSKASKLKSGKSTIPEDISIVITILLLLLILSLGILAYYVITSPTALDFS
ncbi:MAG TPA: hypothetical protein HA330_03870 [Candidatus Thalassarchaeaceae archaeon]|nr:MAG TPA: hypothetical protein D7H85_03870 [Candidatus Poseidoniales archaeon]HII49007.1 hypothetical protein [Candidatus Thalassarchaeaceae archaeon]